MRKLLTEISFTLLFAASTAVVVLTIVAACRGEEHLLTLPIEEQLPAPPVEEYRSAETCRPTLLVFEADWCTACRQMKPLVDSLAAEGYAVERVNIDRNRRLAEQYRVAAVPCFVVVERGREIDRLVGCVTVKRLKLKLAGRPVPAWRYVRPLGYRKAIVRVHCYESAGMAVGTRWSKGSGVLVRWGRRIVVLTARHVVKNAKSVFVEFYDGRRRKARALKVDSRWDCAVLDMDSRIAGVEPAELALGEDAEFQSGDRLESCGYGPDGRLACNSGLFSGYRSTGDAVGGAADWMAISGHARQGDSGGPVFDRKGRVAGILWGTDGKEVVCVQPGRIHALLNEAVAECSTAPQGEPTRPLTAPLVPLTKVEQAKFSKRPLLPWRGEAEKRDAALDARIERLIDLAERQQASRGQSSIDVDVTHRPEVRESGDGRGRSPLLSGLCLLAGGVVGAIVYFGREKVS